MVFNGIYFIFSNITKDLHLGKLITGYQPKKFLENKLVMCYLWLVVILTLEK